MEHSFDIKLAQKYSVNAAILYRNFQYWVLHNKANKKHLIDGRAWTYNSQRAFEELFPYMTRAHIRGALKMLIDNDIIIVGNHNKRKGDRTTWYAFKDEKTALKGCPDHWLNSPTVGENHQTIGENHQALPDTKPILNSASKSKKNKGVVDLSEDILELDLQIAGQKKVFMREINQTLRPYGKEVTTFTKITKWLVLKCQRRQLPVSIFKDAIEWARQAALSTVANKKGLFVAKVKKETGYSKEKNLLGGSQRARVTRTA